MEAFIAGTLRRLYRVAILCVAVQTAGAQTPTAPVVAAANQFLSTLDQKQRRNVLFAFDDESSGRAGPICRSRSVRRAGLSMGELNEAQRVGRLGPACLSAEQQGLREGPAESWKPTSCSSRSGRKADVRQGSLLHLDPRNALREERPGCCSSAGTISRSTLRLRASAACSRRASSAPSRPCTRSNGKTIRPLGQESDKAFALARMRSTTPAQAGDPELPGRRPRARAGPGRQDDPAGRAEGVRR